MQSNYYLMITASMKNKINGEVLSVAKIAVPAEKIVNVIHKFHRYNYRLLGITTRKIYYTKFLGDENG